MRKGGKPPSPWSCVTGPIGALRASATRIGWKFIGPSSCVNDIGIEYDLLVDPPTIIGNAVTQAVRRWRTRLISHKYPSVLPTSPDYDCRLDEQTHPLQVAEIVFDTVATLQKLFARPSGCAHPNKQVPRRTS